MSKSTISMYELFEIIPDAETARLYLEDRLWPSGPICAHCRSAERIHRLREAMSQDDIDKLRAEAAQ